MKKNIVFIGFVLILGLSLVLSGCSSQAPANNDQNAKDKEVKPMALVAGSASSGGSNYLVMSGWAEIINQNTKHRITVEATGGPASNIQMIGNGDAQIGVVTMSVAQPAFDGKGWAEGKEYNMMRSMFGLHQAYMDGVTLEGKGIDSVSDLNGKSVSVGPAGGTPALAVPPVLEALGVTPKYVNLGQGDSINALKDGQIDAAIFFGGVPRPAFQELAASHPVIRLGLKDDDVKEITKEMPQYSIGTIKAGTYDYLKKDVLTLKDRYAYVVDKDVPDEVVYELVKTTIENRDKFVSVHKSLKILDSNDALLEGISIPLHPGAVKAYQEAGIKIPDILMPPK